jgi:SAM-dependent methyltransferase
MSYWDEFYKTFNDTTPTPFARECVSPHSAFKISTHDRVVDLGCGTGRDTLFFISQGIQAIGVDACELAIERIKPNALQCDFSNLDTLALPFTPTVVYARLVVHAVPLYVEYNLIRWIASVLPSGGRFLTENRTTFDELHGKGTKISENEYINGHYRRFLDESFIDRLREVGLMPKTRQLGNGFAVRNGEDPIVLRLEAVKQ